MAFMKNIFKFLILFIISFIFFSDIQSTSIEKIDLNLQDNELGIIFLNLENSNSMLLSLNGKNILYVLNYTKFDDINNYLKPFNLSIDYIIVNSDYNISLKDKIILDKYLYINNIFFNKDQYVMISYGDKSLCIDPSLNNCDYVYYSYDIPIYINDNTKLFLYNDIITDKYLKEVYNKWIDSYKISKNIYTILKIKDNYEVLEIPKNI